MSQPRFAPITAGLLARKGSAAPSSMTGFAAAAAPSPSPVELPFAESHGHREHDTQHKKLFVSLSQPEYERLAIAAVKTGLTRHQLIRDALEQYFEQLSADMGQDCRCVAGTVCGNSC
jgi:hypothetical protein